MEYLDSGGALFISGANLGTDWAGSLFFETHLGALDIGDAAQVDLQPGSHPIANFFEDTIQFEPSASDIILDVIATDGDTYLGGEDFDRRLVEHILKEFEAETNTNCTSEFFRT